MADNARVAITRSEVHATGFRLNPATGNFPSPANVPNPGKGIEFDDSSSGSVVLFAVIGSFRAGISNDTGSRGAVCVALVNVFDNSPNFEGSLIGGIGCSAIQRGDGSSSAQQQPKKKQSKKAPRKSQRV